MAESDLHEREGRRIADAWRSEIERRLEENTVLTVQNSRQIDAVSTKLDKVNTAMFADGSDNEFKTPGVMTTMRKLDLHLDVICTWAKWGKRMLVFFVGVILPVLLAGQQLHWWK